MDEEKVVYCSQEQFEKLKALDWLKTVISDAIHAEREFIEEEITKYNQDRKKAGKLNLGGIEILEQQECKLPQRAASAFSVVSGLVGASYKAIAYVGTQVVKGVNHIFLAEQTLITSQPERHIVSVVINEFDDKYNVVGIERII